MNGETGTSDGDDLPDAGSEVVITQLSVASLLADCIRRMHDKGSLKDYTAYNPEAGDSRFSGEERERD